MLPNQRKRKPTQLLASSNFDPEHALLFPRFKIGHTFTLVNHNKFGLTSNFPS